MNKRISLLFVVALLVASFGSVVQAQEPKPLAGQVLIITEGTTDEMWQLVEKIEEDGGHVRHLFPPHVLIGNIGEDLTSLSLQGVSIHSGVVTTAVEKYGKTTQIVVGAWNKLQSGEIVFPTEAEFSAKVKLEGPPLDIVEEGPEEVATQGVVGLAGLPTWSQTSQFLYGPVAVGVVLPQCNGAIDACSEQWTVDEEDHVVAHFLAGGDRLIEELPQSHLSFVYEFNFRAPTSYEPIIHWSSERDWMYEALVAIGYDGGNYFSSSFLYANTLRNDNHTNWAFVAMVVDSSNDEDGAFLDSAAFALSRLGGPYMILTYTLDDWGPQYMAMIYDHELLHQFYALDQYCQAYRECTDTSGYLNWENQNSHADTPTTCNGCSLDVPSIMKWSPSAWNGPVGEMLDPYCQGQVCSMDSDGDGIPDCVDTTMDITLTPKHPAPVPQGSFSYAGTVEDIAVSSPTFTDCTVNTITAVAYRLNGGNWIATTPSDGAFDTYEEGYSFTTAALTPGIHVLDIRVKNSAGVVQVWKGADVLAVVNGSGMVLDSFLRAYQPDPTTNKVLTYTGWAAATPGVVQWVQWRVDSGSWQQASATDGAFNGSIEKFTFTSGVLAPGTHTFEVRVRSTAGQLETAPYASDQVVVLRETYLPIILKSYW